MTHLISRSALAFALSAAAVTSATPAAWGANEQHERQVAASSTDPAAFPARPVIDNKLLPWAPGTKLVYDGEVVEDGEHLAHRVVIVVTDLVKIVDRVRTRIIFDRDISEGVLEESELAFQAQDRDGTVWSLGEYPEEFEDGTFVGAPSTWLSGVNRARAGILIQAKPMVAGPSYSQGRAPDIDFADRAKVIDKGRRVCVPAGCFNDVWVVDEWDALDPSGGHQIKYHAPGVGVVFIKARGGDAQETLSL
ncbi:MAG: hypothetical protein M3P18_02925, partial [Actinomycetota bacterium]|nr:hypothetical protein [Actinomycetota bacterium]